jgi:hypothetical protein
MKVLFWHKKPCKVLVRSSYKIGVKRNCLIELGDGKRIVVPCRSLRLKGG